MWNNKRYNRAFTLVELLVVISIIAMLLTILLPVLGMARNQTRKTVCSSNLSQLGLAFEMYLNDYGRKVFPLAQYGKDADGQFGTFWYFGFESLYSSVVLSEGSRILCKKYAKLYPYIQAYDSVEICPAFPYGSSRYKPKYKIKWMTYGINGRLSVDLRDPGEIINLDKYPGGTRDVVIFADSAQVNYFQYPASSENPMIEEWHYIEQSMPFVHFRHSLKANMLFGDLHTSSAKVETKNIYNRWPEFNVGCFGEEIKF
jgi:prepilin-type N-terminal cleavage/methylation domain-containing protein/prepilin-type processing-associated H-X9-DG protein